ncbi:hypothetical protein Tco_0945067 [Tanacetum coccineum]
MLRRGALRQHQNESLDIAERNLFDDDASSSNDNRTKPVTLLKALREHSLLNSDSFQNPIILPVEQMGRIVISRDIWLIQGTCMFQGLKSKNPLQLIKYYLSIVDNIQADGATRNTGDIYDDLSLLRFYQNNDTPPWGNCQQKGEKESDPKWVTRSKFKDELAGFILEKKFHMKGIGETLDQHRKEIHEQFSRILSTIGENKILESGAPAFAITTRSRVSTRDPPFPNSSQPTTTDQTEGKIEREGSESEEPSTFQNKEVPRSHTLYHPSKSSSVPFPSQLKKQKKDDDEEQILSIFKRIHFNLPF